MNNVMIDLETTGTRPGSAISAIGAVGFTAEGVNEMFYRAVSVPTCHAAGLDDDPDTMRFWSEQKGEARDEFDRAYRGEGAALAVVLAQFGDFLAGFGPRVCVWGNGAAFDLGILGEAYRMSGFGRPPWGHGGERCFRTLKNLFPGHEIGLAPTTAHHALADARYQAEVAARILKTIGRVVLPVTRGS